MSKFYSFNKIFSDWKTYLSIYLGVFVWSRLKEYFCFFPLQNLIMIYEDIWKLFFKVLNLQKYVVALLVVFAKFIVSYAKSSIFLLDKVSFKKKKTTEISISYCYKLKYNEKQKYFMLKFSYSISFAFSHSFLSELWKAELENTNLLFTVIFC